MGKYEKEGVIDDLWPEEARERKFKPPTDKELQESVAMGKYLLRDLALYKFELVIYIGMAFVAFFAYFLDRLGLTEGLILRMIMPAIVLPIGIWIIKKAFFMPGKKKLPWIHVFNSRIIAIRTVDASKGFINIGTGEEPKIIYLTKLNKHTEQSTGLPCVVTSDLRGENIDILKDTKPDMRSKEFNAILEMNKAVTTKNVMKRMLNFQQPTMKNPLILLAIMQILLLGIVLAASLNIFGQ